MPLVWAINHLTIKVLSLGSAQIKNEKNDTYFPFFPFFF
jgi:hypothetical protein